MGPGDTWLAVVAGAACIALAWALVWSVPAILMRRNDIADVAWGPIFPTIALLVGGVVVAGGFSTTERAAVVLVLAVGWATRLALHIGRRWLSHEDEDRRYAQWRERWGRGWVVRSVLQVFVLQAAIALVVVQPLLIAAAVHEGASTLGALDYLAIVLVLGGILLEATADWQLSRFLARRAAGEESPRYLTRGVWAWSRHPNYAGDAITWIGFGLFGVAGALDTSAEWLVIPAIIGPIVMWWFLRYGSGVPLAERGRAGNAEWDAYVDRTSAFWPRPPRPPRSPRPS